MPQNMTITLANFDDPRVTDLIAYHRSSARAQTAEGLAFSLDLAGLQTPDIRLWTMWEDNSLLGNSLLGMGALKRLSPTEGEIKSMHTDRAARGRGVAKAILRHILQTARAEGLTRVSLETGAWDYFKPAVALYAAHGFTQCPPFADYPDIPSSMFMTCALA